MEATISLDELALFLALAERGSMTQVAQQRDMPKSTVSRTIRRLEDRLGHRLFERSTRHMRLTDEGRRLVEQTQPLVGRLQDTLHQFSQRTETPHGLLRICAPYEFGLLRLGDVVTQLLMRYPGLEIDMDLSARAPDPRVEHYDIVFRLQTTPWPDSDQVARRVYALERQIYAAPTLLARHGTPTSLTELAALPCLSSPEEPVWPLRDREGQLQTIEPVSRLRTPNAALRLQAAVSGLGLSLLSRRFCQDAVRAGQLLPVLPEYVPEPALMYALLPARRLMPAKVSVFLETLDTRLSEAAAPLPMALHSRLDQAP